MLRQLFLAILLAVLLTSCGQSTNTDSSEDYASAEENEEANSSPTSNENHSEEQRENENSNSGELTDLTAHFIDAGQADATLFQFADENSKYTILYDTGDWNENDVVNYLEAHNISKLDLVVISHPHADHIGQMADIMEKFTVEEVWFSGNTASTKTFQQAAEVVLDSDATYYEPRSGDIFDIGPMTLEVLHPSHLTGGLNEDSISVRFTYGEVAFLLTGDAYKKGEQNMIDNTTGVKADILQLGHHGSDTSSDPAFVKAVDPNIAIYSAGEGNSYGHPHAEVITLTQEQEIDLYGTDVNGTIVVTTDGNTYDVHTKKDGTVAPGSADTSTEKKEKSEQSHDDRKDDSKSESTSANTCVDINRASLERLQEIKHIGQVRAKDLLEHRPFESINDLTEINGIGPSSLEDIKSEGIACVGGDQ